MKNKIITSVILTLTGTVLLLFFTAAGKKSEIRTNTQTSIYEFKLNTLDGKELSLSEFKGKKLLLVNVASECGYTPQYKNLQALHEQYGNKVVIIGFPANNFGGQEPGTNPEIKTFCAKNYGVTFLMTEKISVKGNDMAPLYKWLSSKELNGTCDEAPKWNFCKYLIDENGHVMKFFKSSVDPLSSEITSLL